MTNPGIRRVGILSREGGSPEDLEEHSRLSYVFDALNARGLKAVPVPYSDDAADRARDLLLTLDGVLVWVDPISEGQDRARLDEVLRQASAAGVWVSTHPDVILKMGTKDVLVATREMAWGTDSHLYRSTDEMSAQLPERLQTGPRVLKQHRGNGGNGVWKVEAVGHPTVVDRDTAVEVLHAQRGSSLEEMTLAAFLQRCDVYFDGSGCMIDQAYQPRLGEGMVRSYLVGDRVAGFGHQFVTALLPPPDGSRQSPTPAPRLYYGADKPEFQALKALLENGWVAEMQRLLNIDTSSLPLLWDADFLYGPKDAAGNDTYVLCEINVSSVLPFPDEALDPLADAVAAKARA